MSTTLRIASRAELPDINGVIERAVMTWRLPERVKRLSLPLYRYDETDLGHLEVCVAEDEARIAGVAAWEPAETSDLPADRRGLLLHGLYVDPERQRRGIGNRLLGACVERARALGLDGVLIKAQSDAEPFFEKQGLERLPVRDESRDYVLRFWQDA
ncbi:GNAT family N-acetyltransferase [Thioalkalivibrio thiocyanodenitrificans]|uniref:GNAT family N-acetyltransferase n=1 Tax=Thioalkalivibrio thiocyanodenitrificans TaxID=243063 RepID=UPI00039F716C|nr:GNAT family N-acetyltransferase [Thioalkalivibrio thiocyanodenitrificans]